MYLKANKQALKKFLGDIEVLICITENKRGKEEVFLIIFYRSWKNIRDRWFPCEVGTFGLGILIKVKFRLVAQFFLLFY